MHPVLLLVVAELVRPYDALQFRIKMGKKVGTAEQEPVKEKNIVNFHSVKHGQKSPKEFRKAETVSYTGPCAKNKRSSKQENGDPGNQPSDEMRAMETLFSFRNRGQIFFGRGRKEFFILNLCDACVQKKKISNHQHADGNKCGDHFSASLPSQLMDDSLVLFFEAELKTILTIHR